MSFKCDRRISNVNPIECVRKKSRLKLKHKISATTKQKTEYLVSGTRFDAVSFKT